MGKVRGMEGRVGTIGFYAVLEKDSERPPQDHWKRVISQKCSFHWLELFTNLLPQQTVPQAIAVITGDELCTAPQRYHAIQAQVWNWTVWIYANRARSAESPHAHLALSEITNVFRRLLEVERVTFHIANRPTTRIAQKSSSHHE